MNRDVFRSILAMDSYNRGYGANLGGFTESGSLGNATIRPFQVGEQTNWQSTGFYAIAYNWGGETVISYRGTDFNTGENIKNDICNGRSSFTGIGPNAQLRWQFT